MSLGNINKSNDNKPNRPIFIKAAWLKEKIIWSFKQSNKKILWIDDKPKGNIKLSDELQRHNIAIDFALDTENGMNFLSQNKYDLIISDMGRLNEPEAGIDLLTKAKSMNINTPIVIYTTMGYVKKYEAQVMELGAFAIKSGKWNIMSKYFLDILESSNLQKTSLNA